MRTVLSSSTDMHGTNTDSGGISVEAVFLDTAPWASGLAQDHRPLTVKLP